MRTDDISELLQSVSARVIEPRFRALGAGEVHEKKPGDLVTIADQEAEKLISAELRTHFPGALVVGEEACSADPLLLNGIGTSAHVFVIDPVDGTKNFVHSRDTFGVMCSEVRDGVVTRAWIWQPIRRRMYVAELGAGVTCNGALVTSPARSSTLSHVQVASSRPQLEGVYGDLTLGPTAWSCAFDYPHLVTGTLDAVVYLHGWPWDHLPGRLMVTESGGHIAHFSGAPYVPGEVVRDGLLAAASPQVWEVVREGLNDVLASTHARVEDHAQAPAPVAALDPAQGLGTHP